MLFLDKVTKGDLFISKRNGLLLGCAEEPQVSSGTLSLISQQDEVIVLSYKQLQNDFDFVQKSTRQTQGFSLL